MQLLGLTCRCFLRFDAERFDDVRVFTAGKQDLDSQVMLVPFADFIKKILSWICNTEIAFLSNNVAPMALACSSADWCDWQTIKKQCNCILSNEWVTVISSSLDDVALNNNNNHYCCIHTVRYYVFAHCTAHPLYMFLLCYCYCCTKYFCVSLLSGLHCVVQRNFSVRGFNCAYDNKHFEVTLLTCTVWKYTKRKHFLNCS